jgi:hypothetical protein
LAFQTCSERPAGGIFAFGGGLAEQVDEQLDGVETNGNV